MDYSLANIEDQILATLQAATGLTNVNIETHAGQISPQMFIIPEYYEGLIPRLPFIYVRYKGRTAEQRDATGKLWRHSLQWELYVGAQNLRTAKEGQRDCYTMLAAVFDALHGKWCKSTNTPSGLSTLDGTQITETYFRQLESFIEVGGQDEKLVAQVPNIAVYSTTYQAAFQSG